MGGNQSSTDTTNNFNPNQWDQVYQENDGRLLVNRYNPNQRIQQHPISISDSKQLESAEELYQLRRNDPELVATNYINIRKQDEMCSKSYSGNIYTQHIPIRLSNIVHVPFPDVLHLYNQSFNGFHRLSKQLGNFKVSQDCIGVNENHVAKVWHSPNFSQIYPQYPIDSQQEMVRNIVDLIQKNTDPSSMPRQEPSFSNFLYRDNDRVGFGQAKRKLEQYSNHFNRGVIPSYLTCVERAGGAISIRSKWNQTNNQLNGLPSNTNQYQYSSTYNSPTFHQNQIVNSRPLIATTVPNTQYMGASQTGQFYRSQTFQPQTSSRIQTSIVNDRPAYRISEPSLVLSSHPRVITQSSSNFYPRHQSQLVYSPPPQTIVHTQPTVVRNQVPKPLSTKVNTVLTHQQPIKPVSTFNNTVVTQPIRVPNLPVKSPVHSQSTFVSRPQQVSTIKNQTQVIQNNIQIQNKPVLAPSSVQVPVIVNRQPTTTGQVRVPVQPTSTINQLQTQTVRSNQQATNVQTQINTQQQKPQQIPAQQGSFHMNVHPPSVDNIFIKQNRVAQTQVATNVQHQQVTTKTQNQIALTNNQIAVINQPKPNILPQNLANTSRPNQPLPLPPSQKQPIPTPINLNLLSSPMNQLIVAPSHAVAIPTNQTLNKQQIPQPQQQQRVQGQPTQVPPQQINQNQVNQQKVVVNKQAQQAFQLQSEVRTQSQPIQKGQPQWTGDVLNWQFQNHFQPPQQVQQLQNINAQSKQSPVNPTENVANTRQNLVSAPQPVQKTLGLDLDQANSVNTIFKDQSEGFSSSPNRYNRVDDRPTDGEFRVNQSISSITGKQGQDNSSYNSGLDWQNTNEYSTSNRVTATNQLDELYANKRYETNYETVTKQQEYQRGEQTYGTSNYQSYKSNENYGNTNNNNALYSFGENTNMRDYFQSYANANKYGNTPTNNNSDQARGYSPKAEEAAYSSSYKYTSHYQSTGAEYAPPTYSYESQQEYRQYNNDELTSGYRVNEKDNNQTGYQKTSQDLATGKRQIEDSTKRLDDLQLKYSMVEDDHYNVQWDPQILADLNANVHRN